MDTKTKTARQAHNDCWGRLADALNDEYIDIAQELDEDEREDDPELERLSEASQRAESQIKY